MLSLSPAIRIIDAVTLAMMIGGVDLDTARRRKRYQAAAG
jgi:hypothetical protein